MKHYQSVYFMINLWFSHSEHNGATQHLLFHQKNIPLKHCVLGKETPHNHMAKTISGSIETILFLKFITKRHDTIFSLMRILI